ncbi:MAG: protein kinase [Gemmatimonadota bacterium]|nr:MAG: protein kinase [Gemmatimonadota bacterium]
MTDVPKQLVAALTHRYVIERPLGSGGMATVYLARDMKHNRQVAVKVLRAEHAAELGTERFLREIGIVAQLSHPHILSLYDSGEADGLLYFAMPFVEGESLRRRLERETQLPLDEAISITVDIADALHYAHSHGVVHRDVKPGNILLDAGHAVIMDFGIALADRALVGERVTEEGAYLGTPEYMSPEQATGEHELDGRSDMYSLACVLYEMLVGQPPFVGSTARAVIAKHITDPVAPITTVRPEVGVGIERTVNRALSKQPADRFATLADFAEVVAGSAGSDVASLPARSIAVLAFANMSADPDDEYFSDGLSDEIINALTKIEDFNVVSRTSAFAFKGCNEDIRSIGRRLNVRSVLEGSVRRAGSRLRVTAQLINVDDGYHLWSERYDRELEDVFAIQDEIAESVASALEVVLSDEEKRAIQKVPTQHLQAYDYYLRGRQFFYQFRRKSLEFACEMFNEAIAIDPDYALAHAGVADCCSFLYIYWGSNQQDLQRAEAASQRALELDPESAEAHAARGLAVSLSKRYDESEREFKEAIKLNPNLFEPYYFDARAQFQKGEFERAVQLFEQAAKLQDDYQAHFFAAQSYAALHRMDEATATYRRALAAIRRHMELNPDDARAVTMGAVSLCRLGEKREGLEWGQRAVAIDPEDAGVSYNVACLFALEGEPEEAIRYLEEAVRGGFWHREWAERDPDLDSLRDHPKFQAILERQRGS